MASKPKVGKYIPSLNATEAFVRSGPVYDNAPVVGFTMNAAGGDGVFQGHSVIALSDQVGPPMLGRGADA